LLRRADALKTVAMSSSCRARASALGLILLLVRVTELAAHDKQPNEPTIIAPGYAALQYKAPLPGSYALPPLGNAADAPVTDSLGQATTLHKLFEDRVTILAFIYTHCDDVNGCPLASFVMGQIARQLQSTPEIAQRLRLISFSFDAARDTPAVLETNRRSSKHRDKPMRMCSASF
jgi:cytochrome c peroxidase